MAKKAVKEKVKKPAEEPVPEAIKKTKIRVIGIGGGGGNIVSEIASRMPKASFVVANTDLKSLRGCSRKTIKFQFGQNLTRGLGTGMNAELGKTAAQDEKERIKKLLEGQDLSVLVACLGGGTGSGAVSVFAKISKNLGNLTYGIFTLPFKFEGDKKKEIALEALKNVKNHLNAITIIPNDMVFQIINKDTPLKEALSTINKFLSESLGGLIETIYEPGLINIDFADFRTILEGRGRLTYLNSMETPRKENAIKDLISKVLNSPLYSYGIKGAKGVLFNIAGEKDLSLSDVSQISKTISELANPQAKIIFGISQSKKYSNIIKTTLLATGCGVKNIFISDSSRKTKKIKTEPKKEVKTEKKPMVSPARKKKRRSAAKKRVKNKEEHASEAAEKKEENSPSNIFNEEKVRKNALQIRKEAEELEKDMLEKEKFWETPAFLRKKLEKG